MSCLWEVSFGNTDALGNGNKSTTLPEQTVDRSGRIPTPFAGRIKVAGKSPAEVSRAIVSALDKMAIDPQAIVSIKSSASRFVTVSGEVGQGGRFPLTLNGDRLMDVIGAAGGPRASAHQIYVRLTRGQTTAVTRLSGIIEQPSENVLLAPGDQIFLYREPKRLTFLGGISSQCQC